MKNFQIDKKQIRSLQADFVRSEDDNQVMEFSFSSEVPYERYFGLEIISHAEGAMNLERLNSAAPLLFNHDWDKQIGVIEKAWIGEDKRGYVRVRFSKSDFAQEKLQDIQDGILRGVSFGYMVEEMVLTKKAGNGELDEYTVTKSFPYEVSAVTVPADFSVGIGRSAEESEDQKLTIEVPGEEPAPEIEPVIEIIDNAAEQRAAQERKKNMEDAVKAERERVAAIMAIGEKYGQAELARQMIESGETVDAVRAAVLEKMGTAQKPVTGNEALIGMNEKELQKFSFIKVIHAMANPGDRKAQEAAKFELEVSRAAAEKAGKTPQGFMIPVDVLRAGKRDLVVGTPSQGGNLVATDLQSGSFIELLRNKSVLQRAGVRTLNGLTGNIAIPRQTGAATAYWVAESGAPTESTQAVDQVLLSPKTLGAYTDISRKLTLQSSIDVENMVRGDLATVLALEIDRAGLYGTGSSNQPQGLKLITGVNTKDFAAATPTFAEVVDMESLISADNADVPAMKYLFNAVMRGALKTTEKATGYPVYLLEGGMMNGYSTETSNQVESGDVWFGNWADMMIGFWSGLDLTVDPYTFSTSGTIRIVALQDCDVAVRHGESFARGNNTL